MLNLFLRTVFLYLFLLLILRLTGKRQVADLEPFDLIVTLVIADVGSNAISDTNIPLLYSIVPIIGLYLVQQAMAKLCLKSDRFRHLICGTPQLLIRNGALQERVMRQTNYTVNDVIDHLREKDVFNIDEVADAILETNGSMSVRLKPAHAQPTKADLGLPLEEERSPRLVMLEGKVPKAASKAGWDEKRLFGCLKQKGVSPEQVLFAQESSDGTLLVQLFEKHGAKTYRFDGSK